MSAYKHVLIGLDLQPESQQVVERVKSLFLSGETKLSLIHVQEPLSFAYGGDIPMDLTEVQNQLEEQARERLAKVGTELGVPRNDSTSSSVSQHTRCITLLSTIMST
ncbi:MAG: universal stress protein [Porticoccaceae bacterium]